MKDLLAISTTSEDEARLESKRQIVGYLMYLHMLACQVFRYSHKHCPRLGARYDAGLQFDSSLSKQEHKVAKDLDDELDRVGKQHRLRSLGVSIPPIGSFASIYTIARKRLAVRWAKKLGPDELNLIIMNTRPNAFYDNFIMASKRLFDLSKEYSAGQCREGSSGIYYMELPGGVTVEIKEVDHFSTNVGDNMNQLVVLLKTLQSLRRCIGKAADSSHLTNNEMFALKLKLTAFDKESRYSIATRLASHALEFDRCLVDSVQERWW